MKNVLITTIPFGQEDKTSLKILEENDIDYCREVFLTADQTTKLKEVFAIAD